MDSCSHFVFLLAAVLLIIVCSLFLVGAWYTWKHAKVIQNDVDIILRDFQGISKSLKELSDELSQLFPGAAEQVSEMSNQISQHLTPKYHSNEHITKLY